MRTSLFTFVAGFLLGSCARARNYVLEFALTRASYLRGLTSYQLCSTGSSCYFEVATSSEKKSHRVARPKLTILSARHTDKEA